MSEKELEAKYNHAYRKASNTMKFLERQGCVKQKHATQDLINLTQWFKENPEYSPKDLLFQDTIIHKKGIGDYITELLAIALFIWFVISVIT